MKAWDRMEDESPMQYRRFVHYLKSVDPVTGRRDTRPMAEAFGLKLNSIYKISSRHRWTERAKAYDIDAMGSIDGDGGEYLSGAVRRLSGAVDRMLMDGAGGMSAAELAKLIDLVGKMQKLMNEKNAGDGEAPEDAGTDDGAAGFGNLTDAELIRLNELLEKLGSG